MPTTVEYFERHVYHEPNCGCHIWAGASFKKRGGYGNFQMRINGVKKQRRAHRVSWELYRGPIPEGLGVLHSCDTPACVNPDHLFLGDQLENMRDCNRKGRQAKGLSNPRTKLTPDQVLAIRADHRPINEIAADYGVKRNAIDSVKIRRTWAHL